MLVAVLLGAKLAGILGALGAIPIAGAIQVILIDWQSHRKKPEPEAHAPPLEDPQPG